MKRKVEKYFSNILNSFLLLHPIIDLVTSVGIKTLSMQISFGAIIRIIFLIFVIYTVLFVYKEKKVLGYYFLIFIYMIIFGISIFLYKSGNNLINEFQELIKAFYFPILLISLYSVKDRLDINKKNLVSMLIMYMILIFIPTLFNIGFDSYEITKQGSIGFFYSANEISAIISILTPIFILYLVDGKNNIRKIIYLIIYIVVILSVGTKTPFLALIITVVFFIVWFLIKNKIFKSAKKTYILVLTIIATITILTQLIPKTTFYKNINVHLDFLGVNNISDIFTDTQLIDHFIFSQRLTFLDDKKNIYDESNAYQKLTGIGYYKENQELKMIEMDYFDIYYNHGVIGFILFFSVYILVLVQLLRKKGISKNINTYLTFISIILILVLSLFTGHIIIAPAVSYISIYVIMYFEKIMSTTNKKQFNTT